MNANQAPIVTSTTVPTIRAYIAEEAGEAPTVDDESQTWEVLRLERTAGFGSPDQIVLIKRQTERITDRRLNKTATRQVEVWMLDADGNRELPLAWGETSGQSMTILRDGSEEEALLATIQRQHFGENPIDGMRVWDQGGSDVTTLHFDLIANPTIDELTVGNRGRRISDVVPAKVRHIFVHHEAARTEAAKAEHGDDPDEIGEEWTLATFLEHLSREYNPQERLDPDPDDGLLGNPLIFDGNDVDRIFDAVPDIKNERVVRGTWLAEAFDALLPKHGLNSRIEYSAHDDDTDPDNVVTSQIRSIELFQRGRGPEKALRLQNPDLADGVDPAKSHVQDTELSFDLAQTFNRVVGHGSLIQREVTLRLYPAWSEADDSTDFKTLKTESDEWKAKPNVARKFVLNTDGTYNDLRTEHGSAAVDLSDLGDAFQLPRRRPLEPTLTFLKTADDEEHALRRDVLLEWREDSAGEWKLFEWDFDVLENECGISITETIPPAFLTEHEDWELRVTATLTGDLAVEAIAENDETGPLSYDSTLHLDLSDRFHDRKRQETGEFKSKFLDDEVVPRSDTREDEDALQDYVDQLRDLEDAVQITATLNLHSLRWAYEIGDLITEIDGRSIILSRTTADAAQPKYLQVVGITHDCQRFETFLTVEPYDVVSS